MLVLAASPGPGVFATVARALASGFKHSAVVVVVVGIVIGDLVFLLFAIYGLSTIAGNLHGLFLVIKYLGAAYLIYLGVKLWREEPENKKITGVEELSWRANFSTGLFITLGNPKVVLFYIGFLPTFVDLTRLSNADVVAIASVVTFVLGATLLTYGYAASRTRTLFESRDSQRILNRSAGGLMVTTGSVLAMKA